MIQPMGVNSERLYRPGKPVRSLRGDVRNPLLSLPAAQELADLPLEARSILRRLLKQISDDARERAEKCWKTHKAPMAAYWKAVAVYANHTRRLMSDRPARVQ